jgi:hypothetical protein
MKIVSMEKAVKITISWHTHTWPWNRGVQICTVTTTVRQSFHVETCYMVWCEKKLKWNQCQVITYLILLSQWLVLPIFHQLLETIFTVITITTSYSTKRKPFYWCRSLLQCYNKYLTSVINIIIKYFWLYTLICFHKNVLEKQIAKLNFDVLMVTTKKTGLS